MRSNVVDLRLVLVFQTQDAILVGDTEDVHKGLVWLPKSQVEFEDVEIPEVGNLQVPRPITTVTIPEWLAIDKGLV